MLKVVVWSCDCSELWWEMKLKQTSKSECPRHFMVEMWSISFQLKWDLSAPVSMDSSIFLCNSSWQSDGLFFFSFELPWIFLTSSSHWWCIGCITALIKTEHIQYLIEKFGNVMTSALFYKHSWVHLENSDPVQPQHSVALGLWFHCKDRLLHH